MEIIKKYKLKIASRYIPVDSEQIGLKIPESDYYLASVKYDGHLAYLSVKNGKAQLFDRNGDELIVPYLTTAATSFLKDNVLLAGELCFFHNGVSTSHREVSSALSKPDQTDLRFGAFDILEYKDEAVEMTLNDKAELMEKMLANGKVVFAIEQRHYESRKDLISFFKSAIDLQAEGIVVKIPSGISYKVKQHHNFDLVVLGYAETTGDRQGMLRELLLGFSIGENQFQIVTRCGNGFNNNDRVEMLKKLEEISTVSEYTEVSGARTAFIFVKPEMVVEISCLDLINENTEGAIRKARLTFDKEKGYIYEGNENTLSIISPTFVRVRNDKKSNEKDAGTSQAYELLAPMEKTTNTDLGKASEIILREIFTKAGKEGTGVRKFVGLKTNKEHSGLYSPYVVVYSDYSAGRKTPLEQEIFLCASEIELKSKVEELKEENIKKGWEAYI